MLYLSLIFFQLVSIFRKPALIVEGADMKHEIELENKALSDSHNSPPALGNSVRKVLLSPMVCSILAALGIFGGISSLFVGIVSVVIHGLVSGDTLFDRVGTFLLIVAIPMILIGSIFLDEIPGKK